jgi:hypothetical protein
MMLEAKSLPMFGQMLSIDVVIWMDTKAPREVPSAKTTFMLSVTNMPPKSNSAWWFGHRHKALLASSGPPSPNASM